MRFVSCLCLSACLFMSLPSALPAQSIRNTSYRNAAGERVLRLEFVLPLARKDAWKLFATSEGWKRWAAPVASVDLRVGGEILTNYDSTKTVGDAGTIRLPIVNYLDGELLTIQVVLNANFPGSVRRDAAHLQEIIQLADLGDGRTKVTSSMIGWGQGPDWDKTYAFFEKGNAWTYEHLAALWR